MRVQEGQKTMEEWHKILTTAARCRSNACQKTKASDLFVSVYCRIRLHTCFTKQLTFSPLKPKVIKKYLTTLLFCTACANFLSNPRRIHSGKKDKEKEEYGLLCAVICCEQPPSYFPYVFAP